MKKYTYFALYLFLGESAVRILGFFSNAYLARTLNPEVLGFIAVGSSLLNASILISDSGIRTLGFLETSKRDHSRICTFSDILTTKIIHGCIVFFILSGLTFFVYDIKSVKIICLLYLVNIFYDALFLDWYYNGLQRFKAIACARILTSLSYVGLLVFYVKSPHDVNKVPLFFLLSNMFSVGLLCFVLYSTPNKYAFSFSLIRYRYVLKQAIPLGLATFLNQIPMYLPTIILERIVNSKESGYFWVAFKIVTLMMILDKTFSTIFLSTIPRMWKENTQMAQENLQSILCFAIVIGSFLSLMVSVMAPLIISITFGSHYQKSYVILSITSWFFFLTLLNSIFVYGLIAIDQKKRYLKAVAIGFITNCLIIFFLIFFFKTYGASIALVVGEFVFVMLCFREFKQFISIKFYLPFFKSCVVCILSVTLLSLSPFSIIYNSLLSCFVFFILTWAFGILNKNDFVILKSKWKKN